MGSLVCFLLVIYTRFTARFLRLVLLSYTFIRSNRPLSIILSRLIGLKRAFWIPFNLFLPIDEVLVPPWNRTQFHNTDGRNITTKATLPPYNYRKRPLSNYHTLISSTPCVSLHPRMIMKNTTPRVRAGSTAQGTITPAQGMANIDQATIPPGVGKVGARIGKLV
jgi:hypothetical protein